MSKKKSFNPAWLLVGTVIAVLTGLGIFLWTYLNPSQAAATALATDTVKQGDLTKTIYTEGKLSSNKTVTVYASESGTVLDTRLKGTVVKDSDFVARIEIPDGDTSFLHYPLSGIDGYIAEVLVTAGQQVMADQTPIAKVSSKNNLSVSLSLIASEALQIKTGQNAQVTVTSLAKTIKGTISHVSKVTNSDGTYTAIVKVKSSDLGRNPLLDLPVTVDVEIAKVTNAIYIDKAYLQTDGTGQKFVLAVDEAGNTSQVNVTTGFSTDTYVAITQGLSAGQTIGLASLGTETTNQDGLGGRGTFKAAPGGGQNIVRIGG
jgi:multidrug efflux pump subunit AcrA (membrane-fusion protein)